MTSKRALALFAGLGVLTLAARPGAAIQNIKYGTTEFHPYLLADEHYDDNIFLAPGNRPKTAAWVNVVSPGLYILAPFHPRYACHLDLRADFLSYSKLSDQNNAFHRTALADATFDFPRESSLKVYNNFMRTSDPATTELIERPKRVQNDAGFTSEWGLGGPFGVDVEGQHTLHHYEDDALQFQLDRKEYRGGGGLLYKLFPQTQLALQYHYTQINYDFSSNTNDSQTHGTGVGLQGRVSPKVEATISAGFQWRKYNVDQPGVPDSARTGSYNLNVEWKSSPRMKLMLIGGRSFQESIFAGNRYYLSDAIRLELTRKVGTHWTGRFQGGFVSAQYPVVATAGGVTDKRFDNNFQAGVEINYNVSVWFAIAGHYLYRERDSNFPVDYRNNLIGLSLKLNL